MSDRQVIALIVALGINAFLLRLSIDSLCATLKEILNELRRSK